MSISLKSALAVALLAASVGVASAQQGPTRQIQVLPAPGGEGAPPPAPQAIAPAPNAAAPDDANANAGPPEQPSAPRRRPGGRPVAAPAPDAGPGPGDSTAGAPPPDGRRAWRASAAPGCRSW